MDTKHIMDSVKRNRRLLDSCDRHQFNPDEYKKGRLGQKLTCQKCGGTMPTVPDILRYIEGYEAHGGSADDIWPGYHYRPDMRS